MTQYLFDTDSLIFLLKRQPLIADFDLLIGTTALVSQRVLVTK